MNSRRYFLSSSHVYHIAPFCSYSFASFRAHRITTCNLFSFSFLNAKGRGVSKKTADTSAADASAAYSSSDGSLQRTLLTGAAVDDDDTVQWSSTRFDPNAPLRATLA
jgi:hypothetical protein